MRIVVLEQDAALGVFLRKGLTVEGHNVRWTDRSAEALTLVDAQTPDLLVMDASVVQGMDLLSTVHHRYRRMAVLTLVPTNTVEDRVRCLDLGADDCMAKPLSFQELTARCRALLRRQERSGELLLSHGGLTLDRIARSVSLAGRPVSLTAREFCLLEYLLQNAGRCCSRGEILEEVFRLPTENATNVVDVYINYLRKKLSFGDDRPVIMTVRGEGYRLQRSARFEVRSAVARVEGLHASA